MLNIDWFQPYEHTQYSIGVIYLIDQNLPKAIRFNRQNLSFGSHGPASFYKGQNIEDFDDISWRPGKTILPLNSSLYAPPNQQHNLTLSQQLSSILQGFHVTIDTNLSEIKVNMERLESRVTLIEQKQEQRHQNVAESLLSTLPHQMPPGGRIKRSPSELQVYHI